LQRRALCCGDFLIVQDISLRARDTRLPRTSVDAFKPAATEGVRDGWRI
jgi:hypothetical protein